MVPRAGRGRGYWTRSEQWGRGMCAEGPCAVINLQRVSEAGIHVMGGAGGHMWVHVPRYVY